MNWMRRPLIGGSTPHLFRQKSIDKHLERQKFLIIRTLIDIYTQCTIINVSTKYICTCNIENERRHKKTDDRRKDATTLQARMSISLEQIENQKIHTASARKERSPG